MELKQLIEKCKERDRKAQKHLYVLYKDRLYALCLKYCRNKVEAEDNLQETFITIFQKIDSYTHKGSFEGWVKRIAINKAIDRYKKEPFLEAIQDKHAIEDTEISEESVSISLQQMLALVQELPDRYRMVFNMYELDGYTHQEIANALQISTGTSKSNLHRAKVILKEKIIELTSTPKKSFSNG